MSFQYQAPTDRELFFWQYRAIAPEDMGEPNVQSGGQATFICRAPKTNVEADPEADPSPTRLTRLGRYGFVTPWAQDVDADPEYLCTAKIETVTDNKAFGKVWASGRHCIVPVQSIQKTRQTQRWSEAVRITGPTDEALGAAGLWTMFKPRSGAIVYSFAILTISAESDPVMRNFKYEDQQPRMPLFLHRSNYDAWLDVPPEKSMAFIDRCYKVALRAESPKKRCDRL